LEVTPIVTTVPVCGTDETTEVTGQVDEGEAGGDYSTPTQPPTQIDDKPQEQKPDHPAGYVAPPDD